jgi:hypothetical protein
MPARSICIRDRPVPPFSPTLPTNQSMLTPGSMALLSARGVPSLARVVSGRTTGEVSLVRLLMGGYGRAVRGDPFADPCEIWRQEHDRAVERPRGRVAREGRVPRPTILTAGATAIDERRPRGG